MIQSIYGAPQASTLAIDFSNQQVVSGVVTRIPDSNLAVNFVPGEVTDSSPSPNEFDLSTDLVNVDGFGESDEESFIRQKVCTITIHSLTSETAHVLHNTADNPSAVRFHDYYDTYRLLATYLPFWIRSLYKMATVATLSPFNF